MDTKSPATNPKGIFGHVFQADGVDYYFDTNTNQIVEVEPVLADVICLFGIIPDGEIIQKLNGKWSEELILEAFQAIETGRAEDRLFLSKRPKLVPPDPKQSEPGECDTNLRHFVLTVTERCNLRCRYCLHGANLDWVRSHGDRSMSRETALGSLKYFLDRADPDEQPVVSFYGGEALLELDLIEEIVATGRKHPAGKDAMFVIDTNGVLLDDRAFDLVVQEEVFLQISIDGPKQSHDRNRVDSSGKGSFDQILQNLDRLLTRDPKAHKRISYIVTLAPPIDLIQVAEFFQSFPPYVKHGIDSKPRLRVNRANLKGQSWLAGKADYQALNDQIDQARLQYLAAIGKDDRESLSPVIKELFEPDLIKLHNRSRALLSDVYTPGGNCKPGQRKLHVTVDGHFQPCERTGDVMEIGSLEQGIEPKLIKDLRDQFHESVQDRCGNCWALRMCGVCFAAQAEHVAGDSGGLPLPDSVCQSVKRDRGKSLKMLGRMLKTPRKTREFLNNAVVV